MIGKAGEYQVGTTCKWCFGDPYDEQGKRPNPYPQSDASKRAKVRQEQDRGEMMSVVNRLDWWLIPRISALVLQHLGDQTVFMNYFANRTTFFHYMQKLIIPCKWDLLMMACHFFILLITSPNLRFLAHHESVSLRIKSNGKTWIVLRISSYLRAGETMRHAGSAIRNSVKTYPVRCLLGWKT